MFQTRLPQWGNTPQKLGSLDGLYLDGLNSTYIVSFEGLTDGTTYVKCWALRMGLQMARLVFFAR